MDDDTLQPGSRVADYEILGPIGAGGMGKVYRAREDKLGRDVALKILPRAAAADDERLRRFEREARAASALNHPTIVHIYDIGHEHGLSFIAMELVNGETLRTRMRRGPLPIGQIRSIAVQIATGLAKAHTSRIVHRDLKPENVMISDDGFVKLLDFGLAKLTVDESDDVAHLETRPPMATRPGTLMGTVEYMSPEQASGQSLDHRTDQFSLGVMLYEMATGKIEQEPEPLARVRPGLPVGLRTVVERCLRKRPAERWADTGELVAALEAIDARTEEAPPPASPPASRARKTRWHVQTEGQIKQWDERGLRRRLRHRHLTGLELVRRDDENEWRPLHESQVFAEEVPHHGDPLDVARLRQVRGFAGHLFCFGVATTFMVGGGNPLFWTQPGWIMANFWVAIWGFFLVAHGFRVLPALFGLLRSRRHDRRFTRRMRVDDVHTATQSAAAPVPLEPVTPAALPAKGEPVAEAAASPGLATRWLPPGVRQEVERVRELLGRGGRDSAQHLAEIDRIARDMTQLLQKRQDLEEQTGADERKKLEASERETVTRMEAAELKQDRELYRRQLDVIRARQKTITAADRLLERMRVRLDVAEHQIKQLRLDLTRSEARELPALELSSRLTVIRHEIDAAERVEEDLL